MARVTSYGSSEEREETDISYILPRHTQSWYASTQRGGERTLERKETKSPSTYRRYSNGRTSKEKRNNACENVPATHWERDWREVATATCVVDDGISDGLVRPKGWRNAALKAAGNAIVPAVAEEIFKALAHV